MLEESRRATLLVYSMGHMVDSAERKSPHSSPTCIAEEAKSNAETNAPESEMFFISHRYVMPR